MISLEKLYLHLPIFLQNFVISLEGLRILRRRYSGSYALVEREVFIQSSFDRNQLDSFRANLLKAHLKAASCCKYWKDSFEKNNVDIYSDDPFFELSKLPLLSKDTVKSRKSEFINPCINKKSFLWLHTSGTTGSGLSFPILSSTEHYMWSFWWRYRSWHGLTRKTWCGYFGGRSLVPIGQRRPPYWRINRFARQIMFSGYHLGSDTAACYVNALQQYNIEWLHGYPSIISLLAGYIVEYRFPVKLPNLKCITTGAENLSDSQRSIIQAAFNVPVFEHYGQAEAVVNISECDQGNLHVDEDFSFVEFVENPFDSNNCRLVGTNWLNPAFPLLRYDTGDLAVIKSCACSCIRLGRIVDSIDGGQEDYLTLPSGAMVGRLDHVFKDMENIFQAQFVQADASSVDLYLVCSPFYSRKDEIRLMSELRQRLGAYLLIRLKYVNNISRTANGKFRLVRSTL